MCVLQQCHRAAHCVVLLQPEVKVSISQFMSYVHTSVKEMSQIYLATERRYNYTTPKTFLEQIKLYQNLLSKKRSELIAKIERLENGLTKLQSTASQVPAPLLGWDGGSELGSQSRALRACPTQGGHSVWGSEPCQAAAVRPAGLGRHPTTSHPPPSRWMT